VEAHALPAARLDVDGTDHELRAQFGNGAVALDCSDRSSKAMPS